MLTMKGSLPWRACVGVADALVSVASVVSVAKVMGDQNKDVALTWCLFLGWWCVLHGMFSYFYLFI